MEEACNLARELQALVDSGKEDPRAAYGLANAVWLTGPDAPCFGWMH